jgi:hypothetical protein
MTRIARLACTLFIIAACGAPAGAGVNSWTTTSPDGGLLRTIAVHPQRPSLIIASSNRGLHRSADGGATWTLVRDDMAQPNAIVFDPLHPDDVYVAYNSIYRSSDAGLTYARAPGGSPSDAYYLQRASNGDLFAASFGGSVYRSEDRGQTWTTLTHPWTGQIVMSSFTADPNNASTLYATIDYQGTFKSIDRGATWNGPIAGSPGTDTGVQTPRWVYSFAVQPGHPNRLLAGTSRGILISNNGGDTWTEAAFMELAFWIGFDPGDQTANRVIAFGNLGVMRSIDGGVSWPLAQHGASIHTALYGAAADPSTPNRIWAAGADGPLLSNDWGSTVTLRASGIQSGLVSDFTASADGTIHAAFMAGPRGVYVRTPTGWQARNNTGLYDSLPSIVQLRSVSTPASHPEILYVANYFGGVTTSLDSGATWRPAAWEFQIPTTRFLNFVVADPTSSSGAVAYASTVESGLWKTTNFGTSWTQATGLPAYVRAIAVDPANGNVLYASGGAISPDTLYKSVDAGLTWNVSGAVPVGGTESIVVDPANSNVVYALGHQLLKSTNAGGSWIPLGLGTQGSFVNGRRLLIDPLRTSTLFMVNGEQGASFMRSVDGGETWETTRYPPTSNFTTLDTAILDPLRPNVLIAGASFIGIVEYEVAPDLSVSVAYPAAPIATGGSMQFNFSVSNLGTHASSLATMRVTLPAWLTATLPAGCTRSGAVVTCERAPVRAGQSAFIPLTLQATATPSTGQVSVSVEGHERDSDTSNNQATFDVSSTEQADLELALAAGAVTIDRGASTTLTATLTNRGPSVSTATQLVLNLPAGLSAQAITPSVGSCTSTALTITCALGTLAVNAAPTVRLTLTADTVGLLSLEGRADGAGQDADADQNTSLTLTVRPVGDASVELTDAPDPARVAGPLQYTATVRNLGPDAGAAVLTVSLTGATVSAASTPGGTCTTTAGTATCNINSLTSGSSAVVIVDASASATGTASATATVAFAGTDPNTINNSATASTVVRLEGDVSVAVTDSVDPATTNVPYNYSVTVTNGGPNAGAVSVSVPVTGAAVTGVTMNGGTCTSTASTVTCDITSLASNSSATITINVTASAAGAASAVATATFAGTDLVATNNAATANTTVNVPPAPPRSGGGGGGGGGRLDWLALLLLASLVYGRHRLCSARVSRKSVS